MAAAATVPLFRRGRRIRPRLQKDLVPVFGNPQGGLEVVHDELAVLHAWGKILFQKDEIKKSIDLKTLVPLELREKEFSD